MTGVRTTCAYCGVGCGVLAGPDGAIAGDPDHPASHGRLCSKGTALGDTLGHEARLFTPLIGGQPADWDTALDLVAARFSQAIAQHGPDSVALYVSGQLLTEDYYVANKLMKGFIGSANIDTNSRLCMASSVAGHRRAFGTDTVPGLYEDLDLADTVVLVGSNLAWCHPVLYQRLAAAKAARPAMRVVVIDPRRTATCDLADMHLPLTPGSDVALFNGLLAYLADHGHLADGYIARHVNGFDAALLAARADDLSVTGLDPAELRAFFRLWAGSDKVVTVYSQGVNQSTSGSDKVNAILNCHLATGRIGRRGMGPFSVTGQPNAMGGREVGGLANMLACHLDIENAEHRNAVRAFWGAPTMAEKPGLKAVDMFRAVESGQIKALWIIHTNPAVSMPEADRVAAAIRACAFSVVSDITAQTDTAQLAQVVLPAAGWGEKDGTVTNSERCISRQRAFLPMPAGVRPDWAILAEVGQRMGWREAFDYAAPVEVFREYAALSGVAGRLGRDFDISALAGINAGAYAALDPFHWPLTATRQGGRFFADGGFYTPDGRARMLAVAHRAPVAQASVAYPYLFNTGRVRDHWHTMTRTALAPRLSAHMAEPYVDIHPDDAHALGLAPAGIARVSTALGAALLRVRITETMQPGQVFAPMHWTGQTASAGRIDALIAAETDPVSGQPELKAARCAIEPFATAAFGFAVARAPMTPASPYWAQARSAQGWRAELAWSTVPDDWLAEARALFALPDAEAVVLDDRAKGLFRVAFVVEGAVVAALFTAPQPVAVSRSFVARGFDQPPLTMLAGRPGADRPDPGATVCACFEVGANTIRAAIESGQALTLADLGATLRAGTNCGSCRPELSAMLAQHRPRLAAE